jgi:hypothetical protein
MLDTILLVFAFVLFAIAAFVYPAAAPSPWGWGRFIAAGLAFWVLSIILGGVHLLPR